MVGQMAGSLAIPYSRVGNMITPVDLNIMRNLDSHTKKVSPAKLLRNSRNEKFCDFDSLFAAIIESPMVNWFCVYCRLQ
jgi:hypothetical protein